MTRTTEILLLGNQKGGVGKTTNCVHLAAALGAKGRRVLLWDFDANQGTTAHLGCDGSTFLGCAEVLGGQEDVREVIVSAEDGLELPPGVDLLPASATLERVEGPKARAHLEQALRALEGRYDYILMDTAPNLTAPTVEAYRAADWFVLSAIPDPFAFVGLRRAMDALRVSMERGSARGRLLGVLLCGVTPGGAQARRPKLERELLEYARHRLDADPKAPLLFRTWIARTAMIPRAQMEGRTLLQTRPRHKVSGQFRQLAKEVEDRIRRLRRRTND
jgi:chromosome partitioning protein